MKQKKLLIIGGSSDIGLSLCKKLLDLKKYDIILHINKNKNLSEIKKKCKLIVADFSKTNHKAILKKFSNDYDIIINLVGYISNSAFNNFKIEEFYKTINTNSLLPLLIMRQSLDHMKEKRFGRILNSSSIGVKFGGGENTFLYSLSKHMNEFIPSYIRKIFKYNVTYNCIRLGVVDTKIHKKINKKNINKRIKLIPIARMAKIEEIVNFIIYLITKSDFICGEIINITGGE